MPVATAGQSHLLISLLRIGDVLQHLLVYRQLRLIHPGHYSILIDEEFLGLSSILESEGLQVIAFPRQRLKVHGNQARIEDLQMNPQFQDWLIELHRSCGKLDRVFNLTHTTTSAYISGELNATVRQGLSYDKPKFRGIETHAAKYFNDRFSMSGQSCFHYVEAISLSLGISAPVRQAAALRSAGAIYLQVETSDVKKNWPLSQFQELIRKLKSSDPDLNFKVLASPSSESSLQKVFGSDAVQVCSLSEAKALLSAARALITLDTSIKHLAVLENCPVIEICVGSSDWYKTGAYQDGGVVLQAEADCYPCSHSKSCPQASFVCHQSLPVEAVFQAVQGYLQNGTSSLPKLPVFERQYWKKVFDSQMAADKVETDWLSVTLRKAEEERRLMDKSMELAQLRSLWPNADFFEEKASLQAEDLKEFIFKLKTVKDRWGLFLPIKSAIASGFNSTTELNQRMTDVFSKVRSGIEDRQKLVSQNRPASEEIAG